MISKTELKALERFQKYPKFFFKEVLGVECEIYQSEALQMIADFERVAISACHDVGKSWLLARVVLWFVTCFPYSKVITTAPTFNQVKNILWSEIRSAYSRAKFPLGGRMNLTEWQVTPDGDWFALGFTSRNEVNSEGGQGASSSFQGFHAPWILIVFDEATGIPHAIWNMVEGMLTSGNVKFVAIGNPTSRLAEFYKCFSDPAWTKLRLSCFNSPNLIENGVTDIKSLIREVDAIRELDDNAAQARMRSYRISKPYLITLKWVVSMAIKWGLDHPLFVSKVLGEFPKDSDDALIPLGSVEDARLRVYYPTASDRKTLGVDVARFGTDSTVMTGLHGKKHLFTKERVKADATQVVGDIIALSRNEGPFDVIVVDETGMGGPIVDMLNEAVREGRLPGTTEIRGVQFGAAVACDGFDTCEHKDCNKARFVNMKARMFRLLGDDMKGEDGLCLLSEHDIYLEELPTILFRYDSKGRMYIESKDEYKKRTGRKSPDYSDSLALANLGRYDETNAGNFPSQNDNEYGRPFAASLGAGKNW